MSKGSRTRKSSKTLEIRDLRYTLAFGNDAERKQAFDRLVELGEIQPSPNVEQSDELPTSKQHTT